MKKLSEKGKIDDRNATKQIVSLLSAPLEKYNDVVTALKLSNYPRVMEYLDNETSKVMATVIVQSVMKNNTRISTAEKVFSSLYFCYSLRLSDYVLFLMRFILQVDALFELIKGLIKDLDENKEEVGLPPTLVPCFSAKLF